MHREMHQVPEEGNNNNNNNQNNNKNHNLKEHVAKPAKQPDTPLRKGLWLSFRRSCCKLPRYCILYTRLQAMYEISLKLKTYVIYTYTL